MAAVAEPERDALLSKFHEERLASVARQWEQDLNAIGTGVEGASRDVAGRLQQLHTVSSDSAWQRMAALHSKDAALDAGSRTLIAQKNPNAWQAGRLAISKAVAEDPMLRLVRGLERSIAEDTVRNEYVLHSQFHQWLAGGNYSRDLNSLNAKVYAELFLTPNTDPWLGLAQPDVFSGLQNNGIVTAGVMNGLRPVLDEAGAKSDSKR
jgi:hypothetical protein